MPYFSEFCVTNQGSVCRLVESFDSAFPWHCEFFDFLCIFICFLICNRCAVLLRKHVRSWSNNNSTMHLHHFLTMWLLRSRSFFSFPSVVLFPLSFCAWIVRNIFQSDVVGKSKKSIFRCCWVCEKVNKRPVPAIREATRGLCEPYKTESRRETQKFRRAEEIAIGLWKNNYCVIMHLKLMWFLDNNWHFILSCMQLYALSEFCRVGSFNCWNTPWVSAKHCEQEQPLWRRK